LALTYALLEDEQNTVKWLDRSASLHEWQALNLAINPAHASMHCSSGSGNAWGWILTFFRPDCPPGIEAFATVDVGPVKPWPRIPTEDLAKVDIMFCFDSVVEFDSTTVILIPRCCLIKVLADRHRPGDVPTAATPGSFRQLNGGDTSMQQGHKGTGSLPYRRPIKTASSMAGAAGGPAGNSLASPVVDDLERYCVSTNGGLPIAWWNPHRKILKGIHSARWPARPTSNASTVCSSIEPFDQSVNREGETFALSFLLPTRSMHHTQKMRGPCRVESRLLGETAVLG
jgi:hypothetical protein